MHCVGGRTFVSVLFVAALIANLHDYITFILHTPTYGIKYGTIPLEMYGKRLPG